MIINYDHEDLLVLPGGHPLVQSFNFNSLPLGPSSRDLVLTNATNKRLSFCFMDRNMTEDGPETRRMLLDVIDTGEWFDFGRVDVDDLTKIASDSHPLFEAGMLRAPYPRCTFRVRLQGLNDEDQYREHETLLVIEDNALIHFNNSPLGNIRGTMISSMRLNGDRCEFASVTSLIAVHGNELKSTTEDGMTARAMFTVYLGLWTMLNCRGIDKVIEEPGEKLQRARARNRKPPLKRVHRINSQHYITALRETERVEEIEAKSRSEMPMKSRRMHLRRGHLRRYVHDRFAHLPIDRRVQWIEPMIINADDTETKPEKRESYRMVKK